LWAEREKKRGSEKGKKKRNKPKKHSPNPTTILPPFYTA
jgi:hypothetical protein